MKTEYLKIGFFVVYKLTITIFNPVLYLFIKTQLNSFTFLSAENDDWLITGIELCNNIKTWGKNNTIKLIELKHENLIVSHNLLNKGFPKFSTYTEHKNSIWKLNSIIKKRKNNKLFIKKTRILIENWLKLYSCRNVVGWHIMLGHY